MKNIILIIGIVLIGIGCSNPQKQEEKMTNKFITRINSICQLTPDETTKITPIVENFVKLSKGNRDKYQNNPDGFRKANMANRSKLVDTLKTILTPEQFRELREAFQQQKAKHDTHEDGTEGGN